MTLTYKDCKELQEAGFPQNYSLDEITFNEERPEGFENVHFPTLEELIEACGLQFWSIHKDVDGDFNGEWQCYGEIGPHKGDGDYVLGSSPIQAVKNLYCALKTKSP